MKFPSQAVQRRQFLRGAGGFSLAIPFLPSLLPREARAATAPKRLYWLATGHGAAFETNMFPELGSNPTVTNLFADHPVRWAPLTARTESNRSVLSPILSAPSTSLTPNMVGSMNVLRGLDVPFYIAHNTGLHLGNYARNDGNSGDSGKVVQAFPRPTIDQILAWSPKFYNDPNTIKERVMVVGGSGQFSWNYSNPAAQSGTIQAISTTRSSLDLFRKIFVPQETTPMVTQRPPVVDRVLENYRRLRQTDRRLSKLDRQRLDDHISAIGEMQRGLTVNAPACAAQNAPADSSDRHNGNSEADYVKQAQLFNDVIAVAFSCGTSRLAVYGAGSNDQGRAVAYSGSWHQDIAHNWGAASSQEKLRASYQITFEKIFLDLATKLNRITDSDGRPVLTNSLMAWSQECGMSTHDAASIPVITFGSAGGAIQTGRNLDYRRMGNPASIFKMGDIATTYQGVLYAQWLANVLQAMGLQRPDFERWGHAGYGYPFVSPESWYNMFAKHYINTSSRYFTASSDPLPGLMG